MLLLPILFAMLTPHADAAYFHHAMMPPPCHDAIMPLILPMPRLPRALRRARGMPAISLLPHSDADTPRRLPFIDAPPDAAVPR